jgi:hypothetical protein
LKVDSPYKNTLLFISKLHKENFIKKNKFVLANSPQKPAPNPAQNQAKWVW